MTSQDDRGFEKTELVMFNPQAPNFQKTVNLVERDTCPGGYQLVDPDASGKKTQMDLVELAEQVQQADKFTRATASSKLTVIAEQVRFLQEQARKVLEDARINALIHQTSCNFKKIPGKTYYIYKQKKDPTKEFISMISPQEWGASGPEFVAAYRLEFDMSWTPEKDMEKRGNELMLINKILDAGTQVNFQFLPSQYQASRCLEDSGSSGNGQQHNSPKVDLI